MRAVGFHIGFRRALLAICLGNLAAGAVCLGQSGSHADHQRTRWGMRSLSTSPGSLGTGPHRRSASSTMGSGSSSSPFDQSPFDSAFRKGEKFPIALKSFDTVQLRDHQQWQLGHAKFFVVFDGRKYLFSGERNRAIFLAMPESYVPVLNGDSVVTFAESGHRIAGDIKFGLLHRGKLYFVASAAEQRKFLASPGRYATVDLAMDGNCPVSQHETGRTVQGMPATVYIHNGIRYFFAGSANRAKFLSHPERYVRGDSSLMRKAENADTAGSENRVPPRPRVAEGERSQAIQKHLAGAKQLPKSSGKIDGQPTASVERLDAEPALRGYCPVSFAEQQQWVLGQKGIHVEHKGRLYLFAGPEEKTRFLSTPEKYLPAAGGDCVVSRADLGKLVAGSPRFAVVYSGRLHLFAGAEQKQAFLDSPDRYTMPQHLGAVPSKQLAK